MDSKKTIIITILIVFIAGGYLLLNRPLTEGSMIMTRISAAEDLSIFKQQQRMDPDFRSEIVLFNPEKPGRDPKVLSEDFFTAHSPELSKESDRLIFTGKKEPESNRQIWMMDLNTYETIPISDDSMNCFDPFYLPKDHVAFSCEWQHDEFGKGSFMFRMDPDIGQINQITYHPHADHSGSMMHDGRILWVTQQIYPTKERQILMALRPDGSNSNLFYELPEATTMISKARENSKQQIYFAAGKDDSDQGASLYRFSYINPVTSTQKMYNSENGMIHSLYPKDHDSILLSYQTNPSKPFGIFEFDENSGTVNPILTDESYHYIEPVVVNGHPFIPKDLPSDLNDAMDTGIMVFIESDQNSVMETGSNRKIIQIEGLNGIYKEFLAAVDGSFYIHLTAKVPVRFSQLSESGEVIKGPYPWVWVMPGDRRGFTGWDPAQMFAPANQVPQAINEDPVKITAPAPDDLSFFVDFNRAKGVSNEN